ALHSLKPPCTRGQPRSTSLVTVRQGLPATAGGGSMGDDNLITVRGHAGTTPEIRVTRTDREVTQLRLGSSRRALAVASGEWKDAESDWFTIKVWRPAQARNVCDSVRSGTPLLVQGHFSSEHWEADGTPRVTNVITAKVVAVDLANGRASYTKVRHED